MRLDKYLAESLFTSRTKAARALQKGLVFVNGKPGKASDEVKPQDRIEVIGGGRTFVSEGGFKLQKALDAFGVSVSGKTFADLGASTGGFTDCLLQAGAKRVYAVDVGESQLDPAVSADERVVVRDRCNARYLSAADFPEPVEGVTIDVSFISLTLVLPAVAAILQEQGVLLALIKPQFEVGPRGLNKHGIVTDAALRDGAVLSVCASAERDGLFLKALTCAPVRAQKNIEYVALFMRSVPPSVDAKECLRRLHQTVAEELP